MSALGPVVGMLLLGALVGWLMARACAGLLRLVLLLVVVLVALQLIGYHISSAHWAGLAQAAGKTADAARSQSGLLWRLAVYNIPLTIGFVFGAARALRRRRR